MSRRRKNVKRKNSPQFNDKFKHRFVTPRSIWIWFCVLIIIGGIAIGCIRIRHRVSVYQERIDELSTEIKELEKTNEDLRDQMENVNSDEYIERLARERLGMIKEGEVVLKQSKEKTEE